MKAEKKPNQQDRILRYMKDFGSITQGEAYTELGVGDCRARIRDLRNSGVSIETQTVHDTNRWGERVRYGRYVLCEEGE